MNPNGRKKGDHFEEVVAIVKTEVALARTLEVECGVLFVLEFFREKILPEIKFKIKIKLNFFFFKNDF